MRPFGKALTALAAAGATLIPTAFAPAQAAHLEAGVGYSWGRVVADGTWRQSGNPYTMHTNDPTWYVGVGGHPRSWLAWHAGYVAQDAGWSVLFIVSALLALPGLVLLVLLHRRIHETEFRNAPHQA